MTTTTALEVETRFFRDHKVELLRDFRDKYVLIKGSRLLGAFDDWNSAFEESVRSVGLENCLIKQVLELEPVHVVPLLLVPEARGES